MARPSRCRRICLEPEYDHFAPCGVKETEAVLLSVDEYEAIRLIDGEKRTHEQCAEQMGISRTTATETYQRAREKIADSLVHGKGLRIAGGNYRLCDGSARPCCGRPCGRGNPARPDSDRKEATDMRIAVTYEDGKVFQHFGHSEQFKLYDIKAGAVSQAQVIRAAGSGHGALAGFLAALHVDTLICGGIGAGAQSALAQAGIRLYGGVTGEADAAVDALLAGRLAYNPEVRCHHHGEGHTCGHSCGEDHHGCSGNNGCPS